MVGRSRGVRVRRAALDDEALRPVVADFGPVELNTERSDIRLIDQLSLTIKREPIEHAPCKSHVANILLPLTMRMWLHRAELNAMLTRELQKIAGCEGSDADRRSAALGRGLRTHELGRFHGDASA